MRLKLVLMVLLVAVAQPALADEPADIPAYFTSKVSAGEVKVYAKDIVAVGKVQFWVNDKEVAWIRADSPKNSKLRIENSKPYFVRTVRLQPGKNRIEITVDGGRAWFATYSG